MEKAYNAKDYEEAIYKIWKESGYFNPDNLPGDRKEPYAIMMPPPNVTGVLHLGHALENTIMDTQVRFQRMQGKKAVIVPGTDHAAVATQARVEDNLKKQGIENPRKEFGRDGLLEKIRTYAEDSKAIIINQIQKMGTSADWGRLAYTFDEERSRIVNEVFKKMYDDGLIYRGYRVVNWSIVGQSTASNDELEYKERTIELYTFRYSKDFPIPIATVLPETKLGDTAVAVHPDDDRYKEYIGKTFTVDIGAAKPLEIQVIADEKIDMDYGTGALGVTPAHSSTDFEMYQKNKEIGLIQVIGQDGKMTKAAGEGYVGLPYKEARKKFVQWLRDEGLMIKEEEITHNVSLSDRFKDEIWPMPMEQWFLDTDKEIPGRGKSLKELMLEVVTTGLDGDASKKITITPKRFEKTYTQWIENLHHWCISRQIWWGHRIPIWTRDGETYCGVEAPAGEGWIQDSDTLDTWFSSGMWTFSTLGGQGTKDFKEFHPTAWMQMGHEILRLWMARMILFATYVTEDIPFKDVYIHGMLRAKDGQKFSKSLGNGIDPLDVIETYGTDALRLSLIKGIAPGNDSRFYEEKVEDSRNFVNKLWNISRFVMMQEESKSTEVSIIDQWILSRVTQVTEEVTEDINNFQFSQASEKLYTFVWSEFADWYLEMAKVEEIGATKHTEVLHIILKLLHPFIPFVTEVLAEKTGLTEKTGELMIAEWPRVEKLVINEALEKRFRTLQELITNIRSVRKEYTVAAGDIIDVLGGTVSMEEQAIVSKLARVTFVKEKEFRYSATVVAGEEKIIIPLDGVIDIDAEKVRIQKRIDELEKFLKGAIGKLANKSFTDNAPPEVVEETKQLVTEREIEVKNLKQSLEKLG